MSKRSDRADVFSGIVLVFALHFAAFMLLVVGLLLVGLLYLAMGWDVSRFPLHWGWFFVLLGVVQLAYVVPVYAYFKRRGRTGFMKGLTIGAGFTALVNGVFLLSLLPML